MDKEKLVNWLNSCKKQYYKQLDTLDDSTEHNKRAMCAGVIAFINIQLKEIEKEYFE